MLKNKTALIQIATVAVALLVGTALGHWATSSPTVNTAASTTAADAPESKPAATVAPVKAEETSVTATEKTSRLNKTLEEIMKSRDLRGRTKELEEFAKNLATKDIATALKQLKKMPDSSSQELALKLLEAHWIEADPEGALKFAIDNKDFADMASDVMEQMAASDLPGALARAQQITDPSVRYQAMRGILSFMADGDPNGALQLAATLGNFPGQEPLSNMIYRQWSQTDPQAAALRAAQDSSGDGWRSPVGQVLRNWASQDPLSALAWATSQPDNAHDISQIVGRWGRDDLNAAAGWVNNQPAGVTRDAAAAGLAMSLGWNDPNGALNWAMSIADQGTRDSTLERLSREIMYSNPTNGATILAAAGVPANLIPPPPNQGQGGQGGRGGGRRGGRP